MPQLNVVPSAVTIRQFSSGKCNELSFAEEVVLNISGMM